MSTDTAPAATAVRDEAAQRVAEQPSQLAPPEAQPSQVKAVRRRRPQRGASRSLC